MKFFLKTILTNSFEVSYLDSCHSLHPTKDSSCQHVVYANRKSFRVVAAADDDDGDDDLLSGDGSSHSYYQHDDDYLVNHYHLLLYYCNKIALHRHVLNNFNNLSRLFIYFYFYYLSLFW